MEYHVTPKNRHRMVELINRLDMTRDWVLTIEPWKKKRSLNANARLWKLHSLAAEVTGHSAEEMHEFALCRFHGYADVKLGGVTRRIPLERSSAKDVAKFAKFMESTEEWYISEFGVWLNQEQAAA